MVERAGCRLVYQATANGELAAVIECPSRWHSVDLLDAMTWEDSRDPELHQLASDIVARGDHDLIPPARLLAWVHEHVPFVPEEIETFKGWRHTVANGGDCDDSARLLTAMLRALDWLARLSIFEDADGDPVHVAAQVDDGTAWRWLEGTVPGALVGESPQEACRRLGFKIRPDLEVG